MHILGDAAQAGHEVVEGIRVAVGELCFEMGPDPFVRVEFRRVARKPLEMETGTLRLQGLHVGPLVNAATVQQDDHMAAQVTQQCAQKDSHLDGGDVLRARTIVLACGVSWP